MSRLLAKENSGPGQSEADPSALLQLKRFRSTQIVFIALFTSLLALFVIMIAIIGIESNAEKRNYQKAINLLYQEIVYQKEQEGLTWLNVENTVAKGVKLTFDPSLFSNQQLFAPARAKINPYFLPYLNRLVRLLKEVQLDAFFERHPKLLRYIPVPENQKLIMSLRVEGHTDASRLAKTALYQSNIELSGFRAYSIMNFIKLYTHLPGVYFAIAGYGSFRPISDNPLDPLNRRVEIYILPQLVPKGAVQ
ncbi:MAG: cell envelope biogenesis protein OmpA [Hydrogenovibrio sp.]|nr:cell envelope biogenesis protein OmpA [Hydrogenovibrio sp.]